MSKLFNEYGHLLRYAEVGDCFNENLIKSLMGEAESVVELRALEQYLVAEIGLILGGAVMRKQSEIRKNARA